MGRLEPNWWADAWRSLTGERRQDYVSRAIVFKVSAETPLDAYIDKLETAPVNLGPWGMGVPYGTLFMDTHYVQQVTDQKRCREASEKFNLAHGALALPLADFRGATEGHAPCGSRCRAHDATECGS